jgi:hypothetical protein
MFTTNKDNADFATEPKLLQLQLTREQRTSYELLNFAFTHTTFVILSRHLDGWRDNSRPHFADGIKKWIF